MSRSRGMQVVIPGRHHARPSETFTVDENGEAQATSSRGGRTHASVASTRGSISERLRRGRAAVQWPFQSVVSENATVDGDLGTCSSPTTTTAPTLLTAALGRRLTAALPIITTNRRRLFRSSSGDDDTNSIFRDLVPDYVINYLRGETAETVARRKRNEGHLGQRRVELVEGGLVGIKEGRVARLSGFGAMGTGGGRSSGLEGSSLDGADDDERFWFGSGAGRGGGAEQACLRSGAGGVRGWRRFGTGWRLGVAINGVVALVILAVAAVFLALAVTKSTHFFPGPAALYTGSCGTARSMGLGLHAVVSVLAVALVAGGNYIFQVLCSPSRTEINEAHAKKKYLDIGIPSLRNLPLVEKSRAYLAVLIVTVAVITQVIYNTLIFSSEPAVQLQTVIVTSSFVQGADFNSSNTASNGGNLTRADIQSLQKDAEQGRLLNLTTTACLVEMGGAFETKYSAVVLVTDSSSSSSNSLVQILTPGTSLSSLGHTDTSITVDGASIGHCLARAATAAATCHVYLNTPFLVVIIILNVLSLALVLVVLVRTVTLRPLITLGDAVSSFLQESDPTTAGCCLLSKSDVHGGRWGDREAKTPSPSTHWWFCSASPARWAAFMLPWASMVGLAAAGLAVAGLRPTYDETTNTVSKTASAFGSASPHATYVFSRDSAFPAATPSATAALVACLPQILLAALYLAANNLLTAYSLSHESSLHAVVARPLRVSADPDGAQVASLYLTLPRPLSWLLLVLFSASCFALSQSLFVMHLHEEESASSSSSSRSSTDRALVGVGISGKGLIVLLALLGALGLLVLALGFRRAPPAVVRSELAAAGAADPASRPSLSQSQSQLSVIEPGTTASELPAIVYQVRANPLALPGGSCSAVISARCHRLPAETDVWSRPVAWSVVHAASGNGAGHATYTAGEKLWMVDVGKTYA